jgi:hypothetical protein
MKITEIYSHLNGLEFLKVHKPQLWQEVVTVIEQIDASECKTKVSKEQRSKDVLRYAPKVMNKQFCSRLKKLNWGESRVTYWVTKDAKLIRSTMIKSADEQKQK